jgi:TonB family protein
MSPADSPFASLPAPGPHPATAELRAYAAGTLAPADEHRIETHLLDCERCADLVEGFSMSDAATTDHAVAELRTRLQARLGQEEPAPVAGGWAWPRIAAAAALVAAVGGGLWTWQQSDAPSAPVIARQETVAPAPPPTAAPAAATPTLPAQTEVTAAPEAASTAKPSARNPADYAAVTPPRPARRDFSRSTAQANRSDDAADYAVLSDSEQKMAANSAAAVEETETLAASAPAPSSASTYSTMSAAPAKPAAPPLASRAAADTAALAEGLAMEKKAVASKAKAAAPDAAAPALVRNTPMPVTPAINPAPVGGTPALRDYLRREASQFVPEINILRISGTVRIRFIVEADGKLSNIKVARGMRKDYDDEALRLVCEGPAWQPGVAGGKRAPLPMEVTVPF